MIMSRKAHALFPEQEFAIALSKLQTEDSSRTISLRADDAILSVWEQIRSLIPT